MLQKLYETYGKTDCRDLGSRQLEQLRDGLKSVQPKEICSSKDGETYIELLRMFREAIAENDKLHGDNYPQLLNSLLSVGEDGLYSNNLRFIFELIQNVDDCDFVNPEDCRLDMQFKFNEGEIILTYNEVGFTPFNVFAITGIAEAAKNVSAAKDEIGEKGIGFKSVFGVAKCVHIQSGWFSFELYKENFTIPVACYQKKNLEYCQGTRMTLYVPGKATEIYGEIKRQYCRKDALFSRNPLLFLNKLTTLRMYFDSWRSMEFHVSSKPSFAGTDINREDDVRVSVDLHDYENGLEVHVTEAILCTRYTKLVTYTREACQSRYGINTAVGSDGGGGDRDRGDHFALLGIGAYLGAFHGAEGARQLEVDDVAREERQIGTARTEQRAVGQHLDHGGGIIQQRDGAEGLAHNAEIGPRLEMDRHQRRHGQNDDQRRDAPDVSVKMDGIQIRSFFFHHQYLHSIAATSGA